MPLSTIVAKNNAPEYDFTAADGFGHKLWVIRDRKTNDRITEIFRGNSGSVRRRRPSPYGCRGARGAECRRRIRTIRASEEYCYFLAVTFPANQLRIIDYNRVVKDLNGLTPAELVEKLKESFEVGDKGYRKSIVRRGCTTSRCTSRATGGASRPSRDLRRQRPDRGAGRHGAVEPRAGQDPRTSRTCAPRSASISWVGSGAWAN